MLTLAQAQPVPTGHRAIFPVPSFLKRQFKATFDGYTYSPANAEEVTSAASHLLDFAIERYLYHSYDAFVLNILPDYPEFQPGFEPSSPLDSALATAYSEGFLHETFEKLLTVIRELHQTWLDYTDPRLLGLLQTLYDWSITSARQFEDATSEVFTYIFAWHAASPVYAFLAICDELDLPLTKWVEREPTVFREAFGYDFATFTAIPSAESEIAQPANMSMLPASKHITQRETSIFLPELEVALSESGVA